MQTVIASALVRLSLACLALLVTACNATLDQAGSPAQVIEVDGLSYRVEQITASTWSATAAGAPQQGTRKAADLVKAIEKASKCKVTDSSYGARGTTLNAQVDCGSKLKD